MANQDTTGAPTDGANTDPQTAGQSQSPPEAFPQGNQYNNGGAHRSVLGPRNNMMPANNYAASTYGGPVHGAPFHGAPVHGAPIHGPYFPGAPIYGPPFHGAPIRGAPAHPVHGPFIPGPPIYGPPVHGPPPFYGPPVYNGMPHIMPPPQQHWPLVGYGRGYQAAQNHPVQFNTRSQHPHGLGQMRFARGHHQEMVTTGISQNTLRSSTTITSSRKLAENNCSLFLSGIPARTTIQDLLANVRQCGRIYASTVFVAKPLVIKKRGKYYLVTGNKSKEISRETAAYASNGVYTADVADGVTPTQRSHPNCARIVFFTPTGARNFYAKFGGEDKYYPVGDGRAVVAWDHHYSRGAAGHTPTLLPGCSRVLRVRGQKRNAEAILKVIGAKGFTYRLDGPVVVVGDGEEGQEDGKDGKDGREGKKSKEGTEGKDGKDGRDGQGDKAGTGTESKTAEFEFELRFASFIGQAEEAHRAIEEKWARQGVVVSYGADPCASAYE